MNRIALIVFLGVLLGASNPVSATDTDDAAVEETCEPESGEDCPASEDEELERGFDPCLINANLPACSKDTGTDEPGAAELAPADDETGDSGNP